MWTTANCWLKVQTTQWHSHHHHQLRLLCIFKAANERNLSSSWCASFHIARLKSNYVINKIKMIVVETSSFLSISGRFGFSVVFPQFISLPPFKCPKVFYVTFDINLTQRWYIFPKRSNKLLHVKGDSIACSNIKKHGEGGRDDRTRVWDKAIGNWFQFTTNEIQIEQP